MNHSAENPQLNPAAMPVALAAQVFTRVCGAEISTEMLEQDVADGAPTNADGTLHLVHYAAWLVKQMGRSADGG